MTFSPGDLPALPGGHMIERGLDDLRLGKESPEALLVSIGGMRLRRLGLPVATTFSAPEHRLYSLLAREKGDGAHSAYNAMIRRLVSFERAAECAS